jgi:HAMP domain-containing protein
LREDSIASINLRSEALAQGLVSNIMDRTEFLLEENGSYDKTLIDPILSGALMLCLDIYTLNKDKGISFIAIINAAGTIIIHNERELWNTSVKNSAFYPQLKAGEQVTVPDGEFYHTLVPIRIGNGAHLGTIDIGTPHSALAAKVQKLIWQSAWLFVVFLLAAFFAVSLFVHIVLTKPIRQLISSGEKLAKGNLIQIPMQNRVMNSLRSVNLLTAFPSICKTSPRSLHSLRTESLPMMPRSVRGVMPWDRPSAICSTT